MLRPILAAMAADPAMGYDYETWSYTDAENLSAAISGQVPASPMEIHAEMLRILYHRKLRVVPLTYRQRKEALLEQARAMNTYGIV